MAVIDTLRPTSTLSSSGWTVTPSGTASDVTSDDSDATYVTGNANSSPLVLSVGPHGVPADHKRHLARVRVRGEDGDVVASVRLPSGAQVAFSSITLPATITSANGSWGTGLPPTAAGSYGIVVAAQDNNINIAELWLDIDSRAKPTFALAVLDAGVPVSVVTTTNTPTVQFSSIDLDGLPPRQWRAWVTQGTTIVWDSGLVAGAATTTETAPLANGSYTLHAQIWSTVGGVNEFASNEVTEDFEVNVQPVVGPTSLNVEQRPGTPLFDVTVGIPSGLGDYDDNLVHVEVQRSDCGGEWTTIALESYPIISVSEDFEDSVLNITTVNSGDAFWSRSTLNSHTGSYSLQAGTITVEQTSRVTINVPDGAHTLYVWYAVSSEEDFDFFRILVDDVEVASFSGEIGWTRAAVNVAGASTVAFQYDKDDSFSEGNDTAWIDDLLFVGATSDTLTVTDWTAPRTLVDPVCDPPARCEFTYRARLVGLKDGALVTSEWLYETDQSALAAWTFDGDSLAPTIELDCTASDIGGGYLYVTGGGSAYAFTPDGAEVDITGDIDVRAMITPVSWTPAGNSCIVGKFMTGTDQRSWHLTLLPTGQLRFAWSTDGTSAGTTNVDSDVLGFTDNTTRWVRATRSAATGDVTFYTSHDGVDWSQVGATASGAAGAMFNSTAVLSVGGRTGGNIMDGKVHYAEVRSGISGTVVANPDFRTQPAGTLSFVDTAGRTWSYNGTAVVRQIASTADLGYATAPVMLLDELSNVIVTGGVFISTRVEETVADLKFLRRVTLRAARGSSAAPCGFVIVTSADNFTTPIISTTIPTQRPTFTSFEFSVNVPVTGTGVEIRLYPYVTGSEQSIELDNITLTFGTEITHVLEWPNSDVLLRTYDATGPLWFSACGDVQWNRVRPFTADLSVMGTQRVVSADPGDRDYTLNLGVTSEEDVQSLERIFERQLVLVSPSDLPEQWVAPVDQSVTVLKVGRVRTTTIRTIGTGPEPAHSAQEVVE